MIGYPITYGHHTSDRKILSDFVVDAAKNKQVQRHLVSVAIAAFSIGMYAQPSSAIPIEYGEAANEMLNQATQNGAAAGGAPAILPAGQIQGTVPVAQENSQCFIPAMPIEQQNFIAAQQAATGMGPASGNLAPAGGPGAGNPSDLPSFYLPAKPKAVGPRAANTVAFTAALGVICLNALWGEPVAIVMCTTGLSTIVYKLGKEIVIFMAKNIKNI
jgi:hypothetical protein